MRLPRLLAREPSELMEPRLEEELSELTDRLPNERIFNPASNDHDMK